MVISFVEDGLVEVSTLTSVLINISEKAEITASIHHNRMSKSGIPMYNSKVPKMSR